MSFLKKLQSWQRLISGNTPPGHRALFSDLLHSHLAWLGPGILMAEGKWLSRNPLGKRVLGKGLVKRQSLPSKER